MKEFNNEQLKEIQEAYDLDMPQEQINQFAKPCYSAGVMYELRYAYYDELPQEQIDYIFELANKGYESDVLNAVRYGFGDYDYSIDKMKELVSKNLYGYVMLEIFENESEER